MQYGRKYVRDSQQERVLMCVVGLAVRGMIRQP